MTKINGQVEKGEFWILLDNGARLALPASKLQVISSWEDQLGTDAGTGTQYFGDADLPDMPDERPDEDEDEARPQVFGHVGVAENAWAKNQGVEMSTPNGMGRSSSGTQRII